MATGNYLLQADPDGTCCDCPSRSDPCGSCAGTCTGDMVNVSTTIAGFSCQCPNIVGEIEVNATATFSENTSLGTNCEVFDEQTTADGTVNCDDCGSPPTSYTAGATCNIDLAGDAVTGWSLLVKWNVGCGGFGPCFIVDATSSRTGQIGALTFSDHFVSGSDYDYTITTTVTFP